MFRKSVAAAVLVASAAFLPAAAQAATAYTVDTAEMRAGPDYDYPTVRVIGEDRRVDLYGCLSDWSFCDVGYRSDRGWVEGDALVVDYRNRRARIVEAAPYIGIGVLSFSFGSYWDNYYRGRPFYNERGRWERHYNDHYRSNWGPRPGWHGNDRRDNDRRDWNNNDHRDNRPGTNDRNRNDNRPGASDRDRNNNDNRTSYRGKPDNAPAVVQTPPQPRPGVNDRNDVRRGNDRRDDGNRPDMRPTDRRDATPTRQVAPETARPPALDTNRDDRRGGSDRQGAGERRERPQPTDAQERNDRPKPKRAPDGTEEEDKRPGR